MSKLREPTQTFFRARFLVHILGLIFLNQLTIAAENSWQHPLSLPFGDLTYEEWAEFRQLEVLREVDSIFSQLNEYSASDSWASYIAYRIALERDEQLANDLLITSVELANPLAQTVYAVDKLLEGNTTEAQRLLEEAALTNHPRAITTKALVFPSNSTNAEVIFEQAANNGDEFAMYLLAEFAGTDPTDGSWTIEGISLLREAVNQLGYLSTDPIRRTPRTANDSPQALFRLAQALYYSESENSEPEEIEQLLLEATNRITIQDLQNYTLLGINTATAAHYFLGAVVYSNSPLADEAKSEFHLNQASSFGDAFASYIVARDIYHPRSGKKPDTDLYMEFLELSSSQGGAAEAIRLAREYFDGNFIDRDLEKALELVVPHSEAGDEGAQVFVGKIYLSGEIDRRNEGVEILEAAWETSSNPDAAIELARHYALASENEDALQLTHDWFENTYNGYTNLGSESLAGLAAMEAAGYSMTQSDNAKFEYWKEKALTYLSDPQDLAVLENGDVLFRLAKSDYSNLGNDLAFLQTSSENGNAMADVSLGMLVWFMDEETASDNELENYEFYFDRAIGKGDQYIVGPIVSFLLQSLGQNDQQELLRWLQKTRDFHSLEESALLSYLEFVLAEPSTEIRQEARSSIIDLASRGSGFASGYIASSRDLGRDQFSEVRNDDVTLLLTSVSSTLPYPDSYAALGERFLLGTGVEQNQDAASLLLLRGAETGSGKSMRVIAQALSDGSLGTTDYETALQFGQLALAYGDAEAAAVISRIESERDAVQAAARRDAELAEQQRAQQQAQARRQDQAARQPQSNRQSNSGSFFRGLGSFLGTLLEITLVVGFVVLAGAAMVDAGAYMPPPASVNPSYFQSQARIIQSQPSQSISANRYRQSSNYQSLGYPQHTTGRTTYNSVPQAPQYSSSYQSSRSSAASRQSPRIPDEIELRQRYNYDPLSKFRGRVNSDGSFNARNLQGGHLKGDFTDLGNGRLELRVRPRFNYDPAQQFRGEIEPNGNVSLRNVYTGQTLQGNYDWDSSYGVK